MGSLRDGPSPANAASHRCGAQRHAHRVLSLVSFFLFFSPTLLSFCSCLDLGRVWSPRTPLQGGRSSWRQHEDSGQSVARSRRLEPRRSPSAVAPEAPSHGPAQRDAGRRASSGSAPFAFPPAGELSLPFQGLILEAYWTHRPSRREWPPPTL